MIFYRVTSRSLIKRSGLWFQYLPHIRLLLSLVAQLVKNLPAVWETWVQSLDWEGPLEKGIATHSRILARRIPWTEEPGRLQSMGSQRVKHDWVTFTFSSTLYMLYVYVYINWCWKRPWCWERLKAGGEGDDRGWDGWMASPTQGIWVSATSGRWWRTGNPGGLQSMGSERVEHNLVTDNIYIYVLMQYSHILMGSTKTNYSENILMMRRGRE